MQFLQRYDAIIDIVPFRDKIGKKKIAFALRVISIHILCCESLDLLRPTELFEIDKLRASPKAPNGEKSRSGGGGGVQHR